MMYEQLLAHLVGDYLLQSHKEAVNKTSNTWWALFHSIKYAMPFLLLANSCLALSTIVITHFFIDRFRLAKYINWLKNFDFDKNITPTGYPNNVPEWLSGWLLIITDNILHLLINYLAIRYL